MTALVDPPETQARPTPQWVAFRAGMAVFGLALLVVLAHGCHGADEDHEPAVTLGDDRR